MKGQAVVIRLTGFLVCIGDRAFGQTDEVGHRYRDFFVLQTEKYLSFGGGQAGVDPFG